MGLINEDEALIAAALKGSAYAWEKLVKRYEVGFLTMVSELQEIPRMQWI